MSHVMRKTDFCICENKDADQLHDNCEADQRLSLRYMDSTIPLFPNFQASSHLVWLYSPFMSDLVGNPKDPFSHKEAHIKWI